MSKNSNDPKEEGPKPQPPQVPKKPNGPLVVDEEVISFGSRLAESIRIYDEWRSSEMSIDS